jgi:uncharacterized membrane protein YfcA
LVTKIRKTRAIPAFLTGGGIGTLGGLIGLGGAEFRLPLLIGLFGFGPLEAVILNKTMSLIVVAVALPARTGTVPLSAVMEQWNVIVTLLLGSIVGAWWGAGWATRIHSKALYRVIAVLLAAIAAVLLLGHSSTGHQAVVTGWALVGAGATAGLGIGVVAAVLGVAGGELLIPTIIILFGTDLKLAGSLALVVSIPTMLAAFGRYSQDRSFHVVRAEWRLVLIMAVGSVAGSYLGGRLLGVVPTVVLLPLLAAILVAAAVKVWRLS